MAFGSASVTIVIATDKPDVIAMVTTRGRPKFGFGAESWQMASFGIVSVSAEAAKLTFGSYFYNATLVLRLSLCLLAGQSARGNPTDIHLLLDVLLIN